MEHEARVVQDNIQEAHEERREEVHEPLYGLAPEPGAGGPQSVGGDPSQPRMEMPVEEPEEAGQGGFNMIWGVVIGGLLVLILLTTVLYLGIGSTYSSAPFTTYPLK